MKSTHRDLTRKPYPAEIAVAIPAATKAATNALNVLGSATLVSASTAMPSAPIPSSVSAPPVSSTGGSDVVVHVGPAREGLFMSTNEQPDARTSTMIARIDDSISPRRAWSTSHVGNHRKGS